MLDPRYVYENHEYIRKICTEKAVECDIDLFIRLYEELKKNQQALDNLNAQKNQAAVSKDIERGKQLKEEGMILEEKTRSLQYNFQQVVQTIPNLYSEDTPIGKDDTENIVLKSWGTPRIFEFPIKDHVDLGCKLDILDFDTAGQVSGSRFVYLKNDLVLLQFALVNRVFQTLTNQDIINQIIKDAGLDVSNKPFTACIPPVIMKKEVMQKMGRYNPNDQTYELIHDDMVLVASAEHSIGPMHMDQMIDIEQLPIRYLGYSSAFRREAGSYGKDTKGMIRQHQFDKLEMETFTTPEQGMSEHLFMVAIQEYIMQQLNLPYQVMLCCTGDMGAVDYRHIDLNTWIPSQGVYRETHSADYVTDYQARRLGTRFKDKSDTGRKGFVHMNDATAIALGRTMVALIENYQQADGSILIPEVLHSYMGGKTVIGGR
ncbi:MAG TPA: serine--tRNA ligase [Candidatus Absconditabacterales bacterium]|nr:serine--tRNA ligase [Candidatus Absconditabacterales bacterium]